MYNIRWLKYFIDYSNAKFKQLKEYARHKNKSKAVKDDTASIGFTHSHLEALEPKMLFDATAIIPVADIAEAQSASANPTPDSTNDPHVSEVLPPAVSAPPANDVTPTPIQNNNDNSYSPPPLEQQNEPPTPPKNQNIIFIDSDVTDYHELVSSIVYSTDQEYEIFIINDNDNGISQISEYLKDYHGNVSSIHIISHGNDGTLNIGNTTLNNFNLKTFEASITNWSIALTNDADILIYGCNLSATDAGKEFISNLSIMTSADIASSDNATGSYSLGGDWILENNIGNIEANFLFNQDTAWEHLLDAPYVYDPIEYNFETAFNEPGSHYIPLMYYIYYDESGIDYSSIEFFSDASASTPLIEVTDGSDPLSLQGQIDNVNIKIFQVPDINGAYIYYDPSSSSEWIPDGREILYYTSAESHHNTIFYITIKDSTGAHTSAPIFVGVQQTVLIPPNDNLQAYKNLPYIIDPYNSIFINDLADGYHINTEGGNFNLDANEQFYDPDTGEHYYITASGGKLTGDESKLIYTPPQDFVGQDSFKYQVFSPNYSPIVVTVYIDVANNLPSNHPPVAVEDYIVLENNTSIYFDENQLLQGYYSSKPDFDIDGDQLYILGVYSNFNDFGGNHITKGTLYNNGDGSYSYEANGTDYYDTLIYQVYDNKGGISYATITIKVGNPDASNQAPVAVDDYIYTDNNTAIVFTGEQLIQGTHSFQYHPDLGGLILDNVADYDPNHHTIKIGNIQIGSGVNNHITFGAITDLGGGQFEYTPNELMTNYIDTIIYSITDTQGAVSYGTIFVFVGDPPSTENMPFYVNYDNNSHTLFLNEINTQAQIDISDQLYSVGNGSSIDLSTIVIPSGGLTALGNTVTYDSNTQKFIYQYNPYGNPGLKDSFNFYLIGNNNAASNMLTINIDIDNINHAPVASDNTITTDNSTPITFSGNDLINGTYGFISIDADGDEISVIGLSSSFPYSNHTAKGTINSLGNGLYEYIPDSSSSNYIDTHIYTITDSKGSVSYGRLMIHVGDPVGTGYTEPPIITANSTSIGLNTAPNTIKEIDIETFFTISSFNNGMDFSSTENVIITNGGATTMGNTIYYDPVQKKLILIYGGLGEKGQTDSFTFFVVDNNGAVSNAMTLMIDLINQNTPPIVENDTIYTDNNQPVTFTDLELLNGTYGGIDFDPDGDEINLIQIISNFPNSNHTTLGSVQDMGNGEYVYTPAQGMENYIDTIIYSITDTNGAISYGTINIHVGDTYLANQPPFIQDYGVRYSIDTHSSNNQFSIDMASQIYPFDDYELDLSIPGSVIIQNGNVTSLGNEVTYDYATQKFIYTYNGAGQPGQVDYFSIIIIDANGAASNSLTIPVDIMDYAELPHVDDTINYSLNLSNSTEVRIDLEAHNTYDNISLDLTSSSTVVIIGSNTFYGNSVTYDNVTKQLVFNYTGHGAGGTDVFQFYLVDSDGNASNISTVNIDLEQINRPPVANDDTIRIANNTDSVFTIYQLLDGSLSNGQQDYDPDGDPIMVTNVYASLRDYGGNHTTKGTLIDLGDGNYQYTPNGENYYDSLIYQLTDANGGVSYARIAIVVGNPVEPIQTLPDTLNPHQYLSVNDGMTFPIMHDYFFMDPSISIISFSDNYGNAPNHGTIELIEDQYSYNPSHKLL